MDMDSSNDINIKQNTEEILLYLFAQRKLYSLSKRALHIMFFLLILFFLCFRINQYDSEQ